MTARKILNMNWAMDQMKIARETPYTHRESREVCEKICQDIRPFFTKRKWLDWVEAGPDGNIAFLEYACAEWQYIYDEFCLPIRDGEYNQETDRIVSLPSAEQTLEEFETLAAKHAPRSFISPPDCQHKKEYAVLKGIQCRNCHRTREAANDFERRLISKLTPRNSGYVNYGMR